MEGLAAHHLRVVNQVLLDRTAITVNHPLYIRARLTEPMLLVLIIDLHTSWWQCMEGIMCTRILKRLWISATAQYVVFMRNVQVTVARWRQDQRVCKSLQTITPLLQERMPTLLTISMIFLISSFAKLLMAKRCCAQKEFHLIPGFLCSQFLPYVASAHASSFAKSWTKMMKKK